MRIDTGVEEGSEILIHYDPLIGKLVTYGPVCASILLTVPVLSFIAQDRKTALDTMIHSLDTFVIRGMLFPLTKHDSSHLCS